MLKWSDPEVNMRQFPVPTPYLVGDVKVYTFEIDGQLILFDTGPPTEQAKQFLQQHIDLQRLSYVFITHWHPEHCGLAAFLQRETNAQIVISKYEAERLRRPDRQLRQLETVFSRLGFRDHRLAAQIEHFRGIMSWVEVPASYLVLEESRELLDRLGLSYFYCPWHDGCDVIYQLQGYAITGDVILEGIFSCPCIEVDPVDPNENRFNNYAALCKAISQLKQIEDCILLPSHRDAVAGIDQWTEYILTRLVTRTNAVAPLLRAGKSVCQTTEEFFGSQVGVPFMFYLKASEVALSQDYIAEPEILRQALLTNQLLHKFEHLLEPGRL